MRQTFENNISIRKEYGDQIRKAINIYCQKEYGIADLFKIAEEFIPKSGGNKIDFCLARQIPTVNVEHLIHYLISEWMSSFTRVEVFPVTLSFTRDTFTNMNSYKKSLVNIPYLRRGRKGRYLHVQKIVNGVIKDGIILDSIETLNGSNLLNYHQELRSKVFGSNVTTVDLSGFFKSCLSEAIHHGKGPSYAYRRFGFSDKKSICIDVSDDIRPPAEWYYFFHLALFMDGNRVLLESTVGDDLKIKWWFNKTEKKLFEITGFNPLIIDVPVKINIDNYQGEMLEHLEFVLESDWKKKIDFPSKENSIFQAMECLGENIIRVV